MPEALPKMRERPFVTFVARALPLCVLLPFASALAATDDGDGQWE